MTSRNVLRELAQVSVTSSRFLSEPDFLCTGLSLTIPYQFEQNGLIISESIVFSKIRAFRHLAESLCTAWHADAYDRVMIVDRSEWVEELEKTARTRRINSEFIMNHYMIYFDGAGAFEIVAENFRLDPSNASR